MALTDRADNRGPAVVSLRRILCVEVAGPFQLRTIGEMGESVTHDCGIDEE